MSNSHIKDYLQSLNLKDGDTHRGMCPVCGSPNTFTAKKELGAIVYNCYKLSCMLYPTLYFEGMTAAEIKQYIDNRHMTSRSKAKDAETLVLPEYVVEGKESVLLKRFFNRWPLVEHEVDRYDVKDRRAVFFVRQNGRVVDAVGRALDGANPKWLRYGKSTQPYTKCLGESNGKCVVVEDVISAITVANVFPNTTGLALLGTNLTSKHLEVLQECHTIIVALDPDAALKSLEMKREIELWTGIKTYAMSLLDDPKYQCDEDMQNMKELLG